MKLEINYKGEKNRKKHKHVAAKKHATKQPMGHQRRNKKNLDNNANKNTMVQNLWDAGKAVLKGKFIAVQAYLKKQEACQVNNLT